jgi:hypothetical protein
MITAFRLGESPQNGKKGFAAVCQFRGEYAGKAGKSVAPNVERA